MKHLILFFYFLFCQVYALDFDKIQKIKDWELLQKEKVKIEWASYGDFPLSRAEITLKHNINSISSKIENIENYPSIFERVTETKRLDKNIIQIVLDLPFPFSGRDYIVKYSKEILKNGSWIFKFSSVKHPNAKLKPGHVRLHDAAGMWILEPLNLNSTKVIYLWNGELLGNFPDVALTRAWTTQGTEVLTWLDIAVKEEMKK